MTTQEVGVEVLAPVVDLGGELAARFEREGARWFPDPWSARDAWDPDGPTNFGLNCEAAKPLLRRGRTVLSRSISTHLVEGILAAGLGAIQESYPRADIGSYPFYNAPGGHGVTLVVRSVERQDLVRAGDEIRRLIGELGGEVLADEPG